MIGSQIRLDCKLGITLMRCINVGMRWHREASSNRLDKTEVLGEMNYKHSSIERELCCGLSKGLRETSLCAEGFKRCSRLLR